MKNKLIDLNNHLFAQLERLNDESLSPKQLADEVSRARAISGVSSQIVCNARLALDAEKFRADGINQNQVMPDMLEVKNV
jgi:hypothetical protein